MSETVSISNQMYDRLREYRDAGDHTSLDSALRELYYTAMCNAEQTNTTEEDEQ
jgi:hypothetical protein